MLGLFYPDLLALPPGSDRRVIVGRDKRVDSDDTEAEDSKGGPKKKGSDAIPLFRSAAHPLSSSSHGAVAPLPLPTHAWRMH